MNKQRAFGPSLLDRMSQIYRISLILSHDYPELKKEFRNIAGSFADLIVSRASKVFYDAFPEYYHSGDTWCACCDVEESGDYALSYGMVLRSPYDPDQDECVDDAFDDICDAICGGADVPGVDEFMFILETDLPAMSKISLSSQMRTSVYVVGNPERSSISLHVRDRHESVR